MWSYLLITYRPFIYSAEIEIIAQTTKQMMSIDWTILNEIRTKQGAMNNGNDIRLLV